MDFEYLSDEELIEQIGENNENALNFLINKYKPLVKIRARMYFITGLDSDDVVQEGMIGLYNAIRHYNENCEVKFKTFAEICINNQIKTAIRDANRLKHSHLNNSVPLDMINENNYDENDAPINILLSKEYIETLGEKIKFSLTPLERAVLQQFLTGKSRADIAKNVGKNEKAVSNCLSRIRKKIDKLI